MCQGLLPTSLYGRRRLEQLPSRCVPNLPYEWTGASYGWGCSRALLYPPGNDWFSIAGGTGHRNPCPGSPTSGNGFANEDKWLICFGEVFRIYARGKSSGAVITDHDDIFLFYVNAYTWVGLIGGGAADLRSCPGTSRPPPAAHYDICWGEVFELWLR